jgi:hypothetical protein
MLMKNEFNYHIVNCFHFIINYYLLIMKTYK